MALLHYTSLYITLPWLNFTLLDSRLLYDGSTSLYLILDYSTIALLHSNWLYNTLPWLYFILLDSTSLYHGSTSLYLTLHFFTIALLHSTWLYITLPWLYFTLLDSTLLYHGSTSLYLTLHHSTVVLLHSTWLWVADGNATLNSRYVSQGVDRFATGKYAGGHLWGFMLGYVLVMPVEGIVQFIDSRIRRDYGEGAALRGQVSRQGSLAVCEGDLIQPGDSKITIKHIFVDMLPARPVRAVDWVWCRR